MRVGLLGPVVMAVEDRVVPVPRPLQRRLLAVLAVRAGEVVTRDVLVDALWPDDLPRNPEAALHTAVSRLRQMLAELIPAQHGPSIVQTHSAGYRLDIDPADVDVLRVAAGARTARDELAGGHAHRALAACEEALALWRGEPVDLAAIESERPLVERLAELHADLTEMRLEALLESGHHEAVVAELRDWTRRHPTRERAWAALMLAQYRSGRQADALATFGRARTFLADELGLSPGPVLTILERRILEQDPGLLDDSATTTSGQVASDVLVAPIPDTTFVGRVAEAEALAQLVIENRIVTVIGGPGAGKTRLAVRVAEMIADRFGDGVRFVDLAGVELGEFVHAAVAAGLAGPGQDRGPELSSRAGQTSDGPDAVVVLDNCEHLLHSVAEVVITVTRRTRRPHVLITSQAPLGLNAEMVWHIPPLGDDRTDDAVELFLERSSRAGAAGSLGPGDVATVRAICEALDRNPLAIELAAARVRLLSPSALLDQIRERPLQVLTGGDRLGPERHRTILAALARSYDLLTENERRCFEELAAFAPTFGLSGALAVCGPDAFEALASLVDRSLVARTEADVGNDERFRLLDAVRSFATVRLEERPDHAEVRRRHATWVMDIVEEAERAVDGEFVLAAARHLRRETANIRRALEWCREHDPGIGLRIAAAGYQYWDSRGEVREGLMWLDTFLEPAVGTPAVVAKARRLRGYLGGTIGTEGALDDLDLAIEAFEHLGDMDGLLDTLTIAAWVSLLHGMPDTADYVARAAAIEPVRPRYATGRRMVVESLHVRRDDPSRAAALAREARDHFGRMRSDRGLAYAEMAAAAAALSERDLAGTRDVLLDCLERFVRLGFVDVVNVLSIAAELAIEAGDAVMGTRWLHGLALVREQSGVGALARLWHSDDLDARCRRALGDDYPAVAASGRVLDLDALVDDCRNWLTEMTRPRLMR